MKLFKYKENNNNTSNITYKYLMLSLFSAVICASLLCLTSYAWFTSTTVTSVSSVKAATYNLSYKIDDGTETAISKDGTTTDLMQNESVYITLTASNTSASTGYCVIKVGDKTYYTDQITAGSSYSFTLSDVNNKKITFTSYWGQISTAIVGTAEKKENNPASTITSLYSFEEDAIAVVDESDTDVDTVGEDETSSDDTTTDTISPNHTSDGTNTSTEDNNSNESHDDVGSDTSTGGTTETNTDASGDSADTDPQEETTNGKQSKINESEQSNETDVSNGE